MSIAFRQQGSVSVSQAVEARSFRKPGLSFRLLRMGRTGLPERFAPTSSFPGRLSALSPSAIPLSAVFSPGPPRCPRTPRPPPGGVVRRLINVIDGERKEKAKRKQPCDYTTLCALASELQMQLPLSVEDVLSVGDTSIVLKLTGGDKSQWLLLSWHKTYSRVCIMHGEPPLLDDKSAFSSRVEGVVKGLYLINVRVEPFSRIVGLTLSSDKDALLRAPSSPTEPDVLPDNGTMTTGEAVQEDSSEQGFLEGSIEIETDEITEDRDEPKVKRAELWLDATQAGMPRVFALNDDRKVVTAAPAEDKNGNLWKGIGRRYYPPAAGAELETPSVEQSIEDWLACIKKDVSIQQGDRSGAEQEKAEGEAGRLVNSAPLIRAVLLRRFAGLSPALVHQMLSGAGIPFDEPVDTLSLDDMKRLHKMWRGWLWALRDNIFVSAYDQDRDPARYSVVAWPRPRQNDEDLEDEEDDDDEDESFQFECVSHMVSCYYQMAEVEELRESMLANVAKAIDGQRGKIKEFQKRLDEAAAAEDLKKQGDLLSANQHLVTKASSVVSIPDWGALKEGDEEPPMVEISLDPTKSAIENVQKIFQRFKKLNRQKEHVTPLLEQARSSLMELVQVMGVLDTMPEIEPKHASSAHDVLSDMKAQLENRGLMKTKRVNVEKTQKKADALVQEKSQPKRPQAKLRNARGKVPEFMRFISPGGFEVVAGRSSKQNDRVTFGLAKDRDLWFHARGIGGSHVLLVVPKGVNEDSLLDTHPRDVLFAAGIAAFYSKAQKDTKVDVSFTQRKHLRAPPARVRRPGMVSMTREQVVTVRPIDGGEARV